MGKLEVLVILTIYYHPYNSYNLVERITTIALTYSDFLASERRHLAI